MNKSSNTYLAKLDHPRSAIGPLSNTFSAVSEKPSDGVFVFLQTSCDVFTFQVKKVLMLFFGKYCLTIVF